MTIHILTLFPEYFASILSTSILKRAQNQELVTFHLVDIRDFASDKHQTADDRPYGGGPGMVMKIEPIAKALEAVKNGIAEEGAERNVLTLLTSAKGKAFTQQVAREYAELDDLIIICGHYEGVDERVAEHLIDEEVRVGDYVLTGGEPAAAVMLDAVSRLLPGVLGNETSNINESHCEPGKMGFPQYSRPEEFNGWKVPEILLNGNHKDILAWRDLQRSSNKK